MKKSKEIMKKIKEILLYIWIYIYAETIGIIVLILMLLFFFLLWVPTLYINALIFGDIAYMFDIFTGLICLSITDVIAEEIINKIK